MAYTHVKAGRSGVYGLGSAQGIGINSFACETGMFLKVLANGSDNFVGKAATGDTIIGVSRTEKTFASDNETVAKYKVNFVPVSENDTYIIEGTGQTIVFSAALVTDNKINLKINGVAMTEVDFTVSNDATLDAIAAQLVADFPTLIQATVTARSGTRTILVTPIGANSTVVISNVVVTAGASQATATIATTALTDGDYQKFFDLTTGHYVNLNSEHASSGQLRLVNAAAKEYRIVNA